MATAIATGLISTAQVPLSILTALHITSAIWPKDAKVKNNNIYDYIIIGSGAGSILANRLTENKNITVLLVEAGDIPSAESLLPGLFFTLQNSYQDWQYRSEKELATQSQSGDVFKIAVGKILGGTSCINHLIQLRPDPSDCNLWAEIANDDSWRYENVLPYFKKFENLQDVEIMNSEYDKFHSDKGPTIISRELYNASQNYLDAFAEVGKEVKINLNGDDITGYAQPTLLLGEKIRQCQSTAYMRNVQTRNNLHVSYKTNAIKINFDENNNAVSVNIIKNNKVFTVYASREILLCAGVFNSPKLLMLSGIGPREHLESLNISVIQDLPIGDNLQDHAAVQLAHKMGVIPELVEVPIPTKLGLPIIIGAVNLNESEPFPHYQTINVITASSTPFANLICVQLLGYKPEICDKLQAAALTKNLFYSLVAVIHPKSRGEVRLQSSDPEDPPIIRLNTYSVESDLDDMVNFIIDFIGVQNSTYFKKNNAKLVNFSLEDCKGDFNSREYIRCYAQHMTSSLFHQTSTCSIGTVLDSSLKVKGVHRLRVIDASSLPTVPRVNTLSSVMMLAEKGADMVKADQVD